MNHHATSSRSFCGNAALFIILELALTAGAAFALLQLAEPLGHPALAAGLAQRYIAPGEAPTSLPPAFIVRLSNYSLLRDLPVTLETKQERALRLNRQVGYWLAGGAGIGWLSLCLARRQRPGAGWICVGLWCAAAMLIRPLGLPIWIYWSLSLLFMTAYLLHGIVYRWRGISQARLASGAFDSYWSACAWPGWVCLTGIGLLWVTDFAARGPARTEYIGLYQADAWLGANGLLSLSALWRDRLITGLARMVTELSHLWLRKRGPWLLVGTGTLLALTVGWLGRPDHATPLPGLGKPHLSGELLRMAFGMAAAWCLYRVGEWRASRSRTAAALMRLVWVLFMVLLGLGMARDGGPALVITLALCLSLGVPLLHGFVVRHARLGLVALALLVAVCWLAWSFGLQELLPEVSRRAAERANAIQAPYQAASANLAQVRWLVDAAPTQGFGLGRVPWCGAQAHIGNKPCTTGSGAPLQTPSDYASVGLAAVWGLPGAAVLLLALLGFFASLGVSGLAAWHFDRTPSWGLLQNWLVVAFSLLDMAQTLITAFGSFGLIPLTGITLPLLGYGGVALCFTAAWLGLALNPAGSLAPTLSHITYRRMK